MIDNITLWQVAGALAFLVGFIKSIKYLISQFDEILSNKLNPLKEELLEFKKTTKNELQDFKESTKRELQTIELASLKADLTVFINDLEMGIFKTHVQKLIAHEWFERYKKLGGNSYICEHWGKLLKEGKL